MSSALGRCLNIFVLFSYLNLIVTSSWASGSPFIESADYAIKVRPRYSTDSKGDIALEGLSLRLKHISDRKKSTVIVDEYIPTNFVSLTPQQSAYFTEVFTEDNQSLGLSWKLTDTLNLVVEWEGGVIVRHIQDSFTTLKLSSPGAIALHNVDLKGIQLKTNTIQMGENIRLKRAEFQLSETGSTVQISEGGSASIDELHLYRGTLVNEGELTARQDQFVHLYGNNFINANKFHASGQSRIDRGGFVQNLSLMHASSLNINANYLQNNDEISGQHVRIITNKGLENNVLIHGTERTDIVSLGLLRNLGAIKSGQIQSIYTYGTLLNSGVIDAKDNTIRAWNTLANDGVISGEKTQVQARLFQGKDNSVLKGQTSLKIVTEQGHFKGTIDSSNLTLILKGEAVNAAKINGKHTVVELGGEAVLTNNNELESEHLTIQGEGALRNNSTITVMQDATFNNAHLYNDGTLKVANKVTLSLKRSLIVGATGLIKALKALISGLANITIGASEEKEDQGLEIEQELDFGDFKGSFANFGRVKASGLVTGIVRAS
jgi:hypothetical protein